MNLDFLVPGISLHSVSFESGSRVAYIVISESFGVADTTMVELSVLEAGEGRVLLEVSSSPYPRYPEETASVRLRISEPIREITSPDEFFSYVDEILVRESEGEPFREPSRDEVEELELERMFLPSPADSERVILGREEVETPAGVFSCEKLEIEKEAVNPVSLGGVEALRFEREHTLIWLSGDVPFWGLVRSRLERESSTRLARRVRTGSEARISVTESILYSYSRTRCE